jgi:AcrR family transcriptional regulator
MNQENKVIKAAKRKELVRLTRDDWLDAAFMAVAEGGFDKVRVLTLAETLGVTRGSFYWHFTDHADLISALLARWMDGELAVYQSVQEVASLDPEADLEKLLDAAMAHAGLEMEKLRFELALRGMGRRDPAVSQMLLEVDQKRMALFEQKFKRLVSEPKEAADLAALFYLAIVGSHQALSRPTSTPRDKEYLKGIIAGHLIHQKPRR